MITTGLTVYLLIGALFSVVGAIIVILWLNDALHIHKWETLHFPPQQGNAGVTLKKCIHCPTVLRVEE